MKPSDLLTALRELLISGRYKTQDELCAQLQAQGYSVNQSKISRLLHKQGAVKVLNEYGETIYRLAEEPTIPPPNSALQGLIQSIQHNEQFIVIRTSPGSASLIARLLDYPIDNTNILGTVAGDDTVFVAPRTVQDITACLNEIKQRLDQS